MPLSFVLPDKPLTLQEACDALSDCFAMMYFMEGKTNVQFDVQDQISLTLQRAKRDGIKLKCLNLKTPDSPKPDLPLFNALA
jgi:hypothetical protein